MLLLAAARTFLGGASPPPVCPDGRPFDWEGILSRAEAERLAPLLYTLVPALPLPDAALARLRTAWVNGRRQHLLGAVQLSGVLSAFQREGLPVILLKGPVLGEMLYRDPGLRPFTDLDLLVHAVDVPRTVSLLSALGYRHQDPAHSLAYDLAWRNSACFIGAAGPADPFPVDLHWGLLDYPGIAPAPPIDLEEIWARAVKVDGWNPSALTLCPEDLLIYLALHWAVHHAFSGALWGLDLALLLRRHGGALDWERVGERVRRWRVRGALYHALQEVQEEFGVGPPLRFLAGLRPRGLRPRVLDWLRRLAGDRLERLDYLVPVLLMDRGSEVFRALVGAALPAAGWARFRYGKESLLGAYLAHYGRIGSVCLRTIRATFAR